MVKGFKIDGHFIPISFDTSGDNKLQVSELNIWCKANDMKYEGGKIKSTIPYNADNIPEKFDEKKYSIENLKKRYPESKYEINTYEDKDGVWICVKDKQTMENVFMLDYYEDKTVIKYLNDKDLTTATYNKAGELQYSRSRINDKYKEHSPLTNKLHEDICKKNSWGLPTTGKDIEKHINSINHDNAEAILNEYQKNYGTSLISDIFNEVGLDAQTRANYAKHIVDMLCKREKYDENVEAMREKLHQAIDYEKDKTGTMDSTEVDKLIEMLLSYSTSGSTRLAYDLNKDVSKKNAVGLPTTGKNLGKNVRNITSENVVDVMSEYEKQNNGTSLLTDIIEERGLSTDTRKAYITHIVNAYLTFAKNEGININDLEQKFNKEIKYQMDKVGFANADYLNTFIEQLRDRIKAGAKKDTSITKPNGKIDEEFEQGSTGDCWLLASIKAIASRPKGLKILNDSIKANDDGSVTVTLKGVNKTYTISKEELESNIQLSTGDGDVRALEIAVNKYFEEERGVRDRLDINGNWMTTAYKILVGDNNIDDGENNILQFYINGCERYKEIDDDLIDQFNDNNKVFTVSASGNKNDITLDSEHIEQVLTTNHAYAVIRSDSEYVYLVNPWNSGSELKVTRKQFKEFFNVVNEMEL